MTLILLLFLTFIVVAGAPFAFAIQEREERRRLERLAQLEKELKQ